MTYTVADITIVAVAYNSTHVLATCLDALAAQGVTNTVIVDNASRDDVPTFLAQHAPQAKLVTNIHNQGFGRAMNQGVTAAGTALCLLINPDAVVDTGAIAALLQAANTYPDATLFGPAIIEHDGVPIFSARSPLSYFLPNPAGILRVPSGDCSTPFLSGACFLLKRAAFLALGGFDQNIFLYYEDDDLCRRFSMARQGPVYVPAAVVRHAGSASSKPRKGLVELLYWHRAWSRLYVAKKYGLKQAASYRALIMLLRHGIKHMTAHIRGDEKKAEQFGGGCKGVWAFLTGRTALQQQKLS